jgi:hypothetical protein
MHTLSVRRLVLVPALITLAVTLLRLAGELLHWSPSLFNRDAGGGGAIVGIVWLIAVFGIYFALRLVWQRDEPARIAPVVGRAMLAFAFNTAAFVAAVMLLPKAPVAQLGIFAVTSWLAIWIAYPAWPALWRVLLAYAFAARIPVMIVMFLAIFGGWDTHYAKPRPDFPPMGHWGLFFWTALLPQASVWIYLTVVGGLLFGALAAGVRRLMRGKTIAHATASPAA